MGHRRKILKELLTVRHEFISIDDYGNTIFKNDLELPRVAYVSDDTDEFTLLNVLKIDYGSVLCCNTMSNGMLTLQIEDLSTDELAYIIFLMVVQR